MIKTARAVAFAAAAFCATLALNGAPVLAEQGEASGATATFIAHASAPSTAEIADLGLNAAPIAATGPAANRFASLHSFAPSVSAAPAVTLAVAPSAPLTRLVAAEGRFDTEDREQDCLANAVYFEARGESLEGQLAVAEVVLNRARSGRYPTTICAVVVQPAQFSFVRRGVIPAADRNCEAWRRAVAIARIAQAGERRLLPQNVLWYHANYVSPSWGRRLARNTQIGLHIFYS